MTVLQNRIKTVGLYYTACVFLYAILIDDYVTAGMSLFTFLCLENVK